MQARAGCNQTRHNSQDVDQDRLCQQSFTTAPVFCCDTPNRRLIAALVEKVKGGLALGLAAIAPIMEEVKGGGMAGKTILDKMSIYIQQEKQKQRPVERLIKLGEKRDRSVNYLVVDAILEYLELEERKG